MTPHVTFEWSAYLAVKGGGWDEWISENDWDIYLCNDLEPLPTDIHIPIWHVSSRFHFDACQGGMHNPREKLRGERVVIQITTLKSTYSRTSHFEKTPKSTKTKSVRLCLYNPRKVWGFIYIKPPKTARDVLEKFDRKVWGRKMRGMTVRLISLKCSKKGERGMSKICTRGLWMAPNKKELFYLACSTNTGMHIMTSILNVPSTELLIQLRSVLWG